MKRSHKESVRADVNLDSVMCLRVYLVPTIKQWDGYVDQSPTIPANTPSPAVTEPLQESVAVTSLW